jgi:hypothetical protein
MAQVTIRYMSIPYVHLSSAASKIEFMDWMHLLISDQARPFYRFAATGLGAAMWFFVRAFPAKAVAHPDLKAS